MRPLRLVVLVAAAVASAGTAHCLANRRHPARLRPGVPADRRLPPVSVLVPARDEAATIDDCLLSLRAQRGVPALEIVVLDDRSGDDTAHRVTRHVHADPRIRLLTGTSEPPPGWLGKPNACHQLARSAQGQVLVFVDADVRLHPDALAAAVGHLTDSGADLLSAWPQQLSASLLAWLVQPLQQWSWLTTAPLGIGADRPSLAVANGQFLLLTRTVYDRSGGHAAVAGDVLEDIALARQVRRRGGRTEVVDASSVARCLMYPDDSAVVDGYAKSLWHAFGGPRRSVVVTVLLAALYATPPAYAIAGRDRRLRWVAAAGYLAAVTNRVVAARATGGSVTSAFAHPVAMAALAALTGVSAVRLRRGTLRWRGRAVTAGRPV